MDQEADGRKGSSIRFLSFSNDKEDAEREAKLREAAAKIEQAIDKEKSLAELVDYQASQETTEIDPASDTRPLYERLLEQRNKKKDEHEESHKLSNLVSTLDEDDANYLNEVARARQEEEVRKRLKVYDILEEKKRLEQKRELESEGKIKKSLLSSITNPKSSAPSVKLPFSIKVKPKAAPDIPVEKSSTEKLSIAKRVEEKKIAFITGINGQVGSYLAELLIGKGYFVHGMIRRESSLNSSRLMHLYDDKTNRTSKNLQLHYGDLTDSNSLFELIVTIKPHEVYNLAAQSHVKISFELAEITGNTNALGTLRILEAIRKYKTALGGHEIKFYHASTSELFGGSSHQVPQNEGTPFHPRSPYGCSKLYAHSLVVNYRESYKFFAVNGILFNHESPRRGENFVTRKVSRSVAEIKLGYRQFFELGNLDAKRDWGHVRDYVEAIWLMLQQPVPRDYVVASGESHSVREFVERAFRVIGIQVTWSGSGLNEIGSDQSGIVRIKVSEKFFRPAEVDHLRGDASLARKELGWAPKTSFDALVEEMVSSDIKLLERDSTS